MKFLFDLFPVILFFIAFKAFGIYVATAVAMSLAVNASGAVNLKSTVLLSPEEFDEATKKSIGYRPPGA